MKVIFLDMSFQNSCGLIIGVEASSLAIVVATVYPGIYLREQSLIYNVPVLYSSIMYLDLCNDNDFIP